MKYVKYGSLKYDWLVLTGIVVGLAIVLIPLYLIWQIDQLPTLGKLLMMLFYLLILKINFGDK